MNEELRKSLPARMTAIGFILVILCGNFWLVELVLGQQPEPYVVFAMEIGILMVLISGTCLMYLKFFGQSSKQDSDD